MAEIKRFNNAHRALLITKALLIKALPVKSTNNALEALPIKALLIKALPVDTGTNEPPKTDSFTFEALLLETHELVEINEPLVGDTFTFIIDYYFTGSSIPKSQSTTTLISP